MKKKSELTKELYTPKEVSEALGITARTLYAWGERGKISYEGILKEGKITKRMYTKETFITLLKEMNQLIEDDNRKDVIYARVSTQKQKKAGDLESQIDKIKLFMIDFNPKDLFVYSDVSSGLNDNRKSLNQMISEVQNGNINRIFISHKDRLTRFGFNYLKAICDFNNTEIIIMNREKSEISLEQELAEDIVSIMHNFRGNLYGMRKTVKKKIDKELSDEDKSN